MFGIFKRKEEESFGSITVIKVNEAVRFKGFHNCSSCSLERNWEELGRDKINKFEIVSMGELIASLEFWDENKKKPFVTFRDLDPSCADLIISNTLFERKGKLFVVKNFESKDYGRKNHGRMEFVRNVKSKP